MTLYKQYIKNRVELSYSFWFFIIGNPRWFCRIWKGRNYYESYGRNKFEAYRKAYNQILNTENHEKKFCLFTVHSSKFCSVSPDCDTCDRQPQKK